MTIVLVFCGSCRHFSEGFSDRPYEVCLAAVSTSRLVTYKGIVDAPPPTPAERNGRNNCRDFETVRR